eukprot:TRINITY_DN229_c0_g1_i2.p1 TRINITY_DN229_c0_g1~~TRINITY_DN229_c0_g1_i2.p1  ORF type:complete len:341 (-),score=117.04 TRINITY_DN229_c0_g1_i2:123-1145(-)
MDQAQGAVFPPMESLKVNGERGFFPSTPESPCTTLCPFQEKCRNQKERKKSLRLQPTTNYVSTSTSTSISTQTQTTTCRGDKQSQNGIWGTKTTTPSTTTELKKTINNTIILFPDFSITLPIKDSCTFQKALDDEIKPFLSVSHLDFFIRPTTQDPPGPLGMHEDVAKRVWKHLSPSSKRLALDPNAGGNSVWSEVYSFEVLQRAFGAELVKTEMEIEYWPEGSKKTDYICKIGGQLVGVSVTRAMKFKGEFTEEDAMKLLTKKLFGIQQSTQNVSREYNWKKQILHTWSQNAQTTKLLIEQFEKLDEALKSNTVLFITETQDNGSWLFGAYFPEFLKNM